MYSGDVSPLSNVAGELIQFAGECDLRCIRACVRLQRETICSRNHRVGKNHIIRVEECFQRGYAGAGDCKVSGTVAGVRWRAFRKSHGKKVAATILHKYRGYRLRIRNIHVDPGANIAAIAQVTQLLVDRVQCKWPPSVLYDKPGWKISHVVHTGLIGGVLLTKRKGSERNLLQQELGDIRANYITRRETS